MATCDDLMNLGPFMQSYIFNINARQQNVSAIQDIDSSFEKTYSDVDEKPCTQEDSKSDVTIDPSQLSPRSHKYFTRTKRGSKKRASTKRSASTPKKPAKLTDRQLRIKKWLVTAYMYCPKAKVSSRLILQRACKLFGPMTQKALGFLMYQAFPGVERVKDLTWGHSFKGIKEKPTNEPRLNRNMYPSTLPTSAMLNYTPVLSPALRLKSSPVISPFQINNHERDFIENFCAERNESPLENMHTMSNSFLHSTQSFNQDANNITDAFNIKPPHPLTAVGLVPVSKEDETRFPVDLSPAVSMKIGQTPEGSDVNLPLCGRGSDFASSEFNQRSLTAQSSQNVVKTEPLETVEENEFVKCYTESYAKEQNTNFKNLFNMPTDLPAAQEQIGFLIQYIHQREESFERLEKQFTLLLRNFNEFAHSFKKFKTDRIPFSNERESNGN